MERSLPRAALRMVVLLAAIVLAVEVAGQNVATQKTECPTCAPATTAVGGGGLLDTAGFPPRWECGVWTAAHGWTHILSDFAIWLAYLSIPAVLLWVARKRPDFPFRHLFAMFGLFIVACGFTHFLEAIIFWWPAYRLLGLVKLLTAVVSIWTAVVLSRVMPDALALKSPAQLEETVRERTAELVENEKKLERSKEEALESSHAKSAFLANMSHEVRTPLTAILGYSEILTNESESRNDRRNAATIHRNAEHLLGVLNDLLDLSKIEAGKLEISLDDMDVHELLDDSVELFRARARENQVDLRREISPDVPASICSDSLRVRQALFNLLGNAIKFTHGGRVTVATSVQGEELVFDVVDTGEGIAADAREKIFGEFEQADASTSQRHGGTGLGLAISVRIAQLLGGDLTLESSELGRGSHFQLRVPMRLSEVSGSSFHPPTELTEEVDLEGLDIVLADDAPDIRALMVHFLGSEGAEVTTAENGAQVVELIEARLRDSNPPDLVLMDMQMPEVDGYEATRRLRKLGYAGPVVALTAHAMATHERKCLAAGCTGFESKPIQRQRLLRTVGAQARSHTSERGDPSVH